MKEISTIPFRKSRILLTQLCHFSNSLFVTGRPQPCIIHLKSMLESCCPLLCLWAPYFSSATSPCIAIGYLPTDCITIGCLLIDCIAIGCMPIGCIAIGCIAIHPLSQFWVKLNYSLPTSPRHHHYQVNQRSPLGLFFSSCFWIFGLLVM